MILPFKTSTSQNFAVARRLLLWATGIAALISMSSIAPLSVRAQAVCDIPLIIQEGAVPPNVLFVLDNSGSMNSALWHDAYDESVAYTGTFQSDKTYYVGSTRNYVPQSFDSSWASSPSAPLITADSGRSARYAGNYLNWIFYHATDEQRSGLPQVTRMQVARSAVIQVMRESTGLRYGLMVFDYDDGGRLVAALGTDPATLESRVLATPADSWTPTAETLVDVVGYFRDDNDAIEYRCQQNFVILVSDGLPTKDRDVPPWIGDQDGDGREPGSCASIGAPYSDSNDCSDYMDDVAWYLAHNDLRDDLDGDQIVVTYSIGFGLDAPILRDTAENGLGLYRVAWDLETLVQSLGTVIGDIVNRISSGAAVAVVSTEQSSESMLFRGKFMPGLWQGYLEAHRLPYNARQTPAWEAGSILERRSAASREIFTSIDGIAVEFTNSEIDLISPLLDADSPQHAEEIVNYVRGEEIAGYRDRRGWKLGDLVYATPVVVAKPSYFYLDPGYQQFLINYEDRMPVVYIGANDGMLHAFSVETGTELWAYVPRSVLPNLQDLLSPDYCHTSYVDLSPKAYDVRINGSWRTVLLGGLRTGGDSYFALDITNPMSPSLLWETSVPPITFSFTEAKLVQTEYGPLLWTGSGPSAEGRSAFSAMLVTTGQIIGWGYYGQISGLNMATTPTAIDLDFDGLEDFVYQGDLEGNLWRWSVRGAPSEWFGQMIYQGYEPIQGAPALTTDANGDVLVYFGTGRYLTGEDVVDDAMRGFYCVRDKIDGQALVTQSDLVDQTRRINDIADAPGWFFELLEEPGERVTESAAVVAGVVYFTSFAPSNEACSAGGRSWLYSVDYQNSSSVEGEEEDTIDGRVEDLGEGIASRPVVNLGDNTLVVQTSDARLSISELRTQPRTIEVHSWRETYPDAEAASTQPVDETQ